nr:hypothetical protein GGBNIMDK_00105 [Bacillus cereus]
MHKNLQKITSCMEEAHQESHQVAKTRKSYERLYKTFKWVKIFICLVTLYIETEPGIVEKFVPGSAEIV